MERKKMGMSENEHKNIKEIGELLRQKRNEINVSLKEAENATSIRMNYLQALEEGEMNKLISPVYALGFFKQYASFLGLDGEQLARENQFLFARAEAQQFAYGIGTLEVRSHPGSGVKWFPNIVWILFFLLSLIVAWYLSRYLGLV